MNKQTLSVHAAILGANLIYGLNYVVAKDVMPDFILPSGFILLRVSVACVLFFLLAQILNVKESIGRSDWPRLVICGFFGVAANQLLFFNGLNITTPINAGIIMTSNPILVLLGSAVILNELISKRKLLGVFLGLTGAVLLILYKSGSGAIELSLDTAAGDFMVFLNAACYAAFLVLVKPLMVKYNAITVIKYAFLVGLVFVLPFGFTELTQAQFTEMPPVIIVETVFVVLFTTFLAYLLNSFALTKAKPTTVSIYIYSQPVFAALFAVILGADTITGIKLVSAALIFSGVYLVSVPRKTKPRGS